jgi:hypothetical protein
MSANKLRNLKNKFKLNSHFAFWRMLNLIIVAILLGSCIFTSLFIYNNINTALINSTAILNIKSNIKFDNLKIKDYDKVRNNIEARKKLTQFSINDRNIFKYDTLINTNTSTTSTIESTKTNE